MRAPDPTLPPEVQRDLDAMDDAVAGRPPTDGDPLLAELAALVAEARPAPDPGWARELDARAERGFARPPRERRRRLRLVLAPAAGLAACVLIAVVIGLASDQPGSGPPTGLTSSGGGSAGAGGESAASQ